MTLIKEKIESIIKSNGDKITISGQIFDSVKNNNVFSVLHFDENPFKPGRKFEHNKEKYQIRSYYHDGLIGKILT
jgi:hypothetical protein